MRSVVLGPVLERALVCLAGAAITLETLDGPVDGKIVLPPSLPAWIVFANCLSFFVYVYVFDGWAHSQFEGRSLTHGRTANSKDAAGLSGESGESSQS